MKNGLRGTKKADSIRPTERAEQFREFAFLLTGEIIMHLVAFLDESGHHDKSGSLPGSGQPSIAGFASSVPEWESFCIKWQSVLSKYSVPYFHFYEWSEASKIIRGKRRRPNNFEQNMFFGFDESQMNNFLYEMAEVAGDGNKVLVGGGVIAGGGGAPLDHLLIITFHQLLQDIRSAVPNWHGTVSVVFDEPDPTWKSAISVAHSIVQSKQPSLKELVFANKMDRPELQAADMVAYRARQLLERYSEEGLEVFPVPRIDTLIFASSFWQFARGFNGPYLTPKFMKPKK